MSDKLGWMVNRTDRSPEATRDHYVSAMGSDLGALFYGLWSEVALLYRDWGVFIDLFTNLRRTELLNKAAPVFFRTVQVALFEATVLRIARLTDPPKSAGKSNLTIHRLTELTNDPTLVAILRLLVEKAKLAAAFCRDWRNRQIAHTDLELALGSPASPLETATIEKMKAAITALGEILNAVSRHYVNSTTLFDFMDEPGGAQSLVKIVKDGLTLKANGRRRSAAASFPTFETTARWNRMDFARLN